MPDGKSVRITLIFFELQFKVDGLVDEVVTNCVFGATVKKFDVKCVSVDFTETDVSKFLIGHTLHVRIYQRLR